MATVTHKNAAGNTTDANTITSASFTPAVGDLLVVLAVATGSVDPGDVNVTPTNGVSSFTKIDSGIGGPSLHTHYIFVADQLTTGTSSMSLTLDVTGDIATGLFIGVAAVAGMSKVGAAAVRQSTKIDNGAGGIAPVFTFPGACLTANVTLAVLGNVSTGGLSVPTNWTEPAGSDITWSTPTYGVHYIFRNSGFTGTTITYPSTETAHGGVAVELDTSASGPNLGTVTGAVDWVGAATGARGSAGAGSGAAAWVGVANGARPSRGASAAAISWTGTTNGARVSRGAATGALTWAGVTSGTRTSRGTATGAVSWAGSANGTRTSRGNTTGAISWAGVVNGIAPVAGAKTGNASGAISWVGAANGTRRSAGVTAGAIAWSGAASGKRVPKGLATAAISWAGASNGKRRPIGAAIGAIAWAAAALGRRIAKGATSGTVTWAGSSHGNSTDTPEPIIVYATRLATPTAVGQLADPLYTTGHATPTATGRLTDQHGTNLSTPSVTGAISEL